jgi:hypothetical protein
MVAGDIDLGEDVEALLGQRGPGAFDGVGKACF